MVIATTVTALHCNFGYCVFVVKIIYTCINLHLESSYTVNRPCTSATTSAQENRQNNGRATKTRQTKKKSDDDDKINGPVILKHLLETVCFVRIRVCFSTKARKKIIKNWKEGESEWERQKKKPKTNQKKNDTLKLLAKQIYKWQILMGKCFQKLWIRGPISCVFYSWPQISSNDIEKQQRKTYARCACIFKCKMKRKRRNVSFWAFYFMSCAVHIN